MYIRPGRAGLSLSHSPTFLRQHYCLFPIQSPFLHATSHMSYRGDRGRARGGGGSDRGRGGYGRGDGGGRGYGGGGGRRGFDRGFDRGRGGGRGGGPREQGGYVAMLPHCSHALLLTQSPRRVFLPDVPAVVDARLQDNTQEQVVTGLRSIRLQDSDLPTRPGFGTVGTPIKLRANFFPIKVPKGPLFEYDVTIAPAVSIKRVKRRIFQLAELTNDWGQANMRGTVAHDHSSKLIAARQLDQPLVITVPFTDEEGEKPAPARTQPKGGKKAGKPGGKPVEYTLTITFIQQLETQSLLKYVTLDLLASHEDMHSTWGLQHPIPPKFAC